ncbi:hypothetical protein D9613_012750 [Agrocybe pediades]|uniref:Uncharacterized protein n=1 Tax=Agrocybe pediades TaxID=84607 RepID=A0A8H4QLF0_9AGAR|nr:hypothetical protein D9613_012750 [Agrocybe pediades]
MHLAPVLRSPFSNTRVRARILPGGVSRRRGWVGDEESEEEVEEWEIAASCYQQALSSSSATAKTLGRRAIRSEAQASQSPYWARVTSNNSNTLAPEDGARRLQAG